MEEPTPKGTAEWYGWFLSDEQVSARAAAEQAKRDAIAARDARPITYGELRAALRDALRELVSDTDDRITLSAYAAVHGALDKIMESLGMDEFGE